MKTYDVRGKPLLFQDDRITRPYIGGKLLHEWRRMSAVEDSHQCEELLVSSIGAIVKGEEEGYAISRVIDAQGGKLLSEIISEDPIGILGKAYQDYHPNQLSVLARAGDTIVRLVLQCHPKQEDARRYFHSSIGKSEAWYIARTREVDGQSPCIYAGFKPHVTKANWKSLFEAQDIEGMVNCLHQLPVKQGDVIFIPAGMPHAVGPGCLFLEIHECSDITIRAQSEVNGVTLSDEEMFYGLTSEQGLLLFDDTTYTREEIIQKVMMKDRVLRQDENYVLHDHITWKDTPAFAMQTIDILNYYTLPVFDGHRILVAITGDVQLVYEDECLTLIQGHGALLPANCTALTIKGNQAKVMVGYPSKL